MTEKRPIIDWNTSRLRDVPTDESSEDEEEKDSSLEEDTSYTEVDVSEVSSSEMETPDTIDLQDEPSSDSRFS